MPDFKRYTLSPNFPSGLAIASYAGISPASLGYSDCDITITHSVMLECPGALKLLKQLGSAFIVKICFHRENPPKLNISDFKSP